MVIWWNIMSSPPIVSSLRPRQIGTTIAEELAEANAPGKKKAGLELRGGFSDQLVIDVIDDLFGGEWVDLFVGACLILKDLFHSLKFGFQTNDFTQRVSSGFCCHCSSRNHWAIKSIILSHMEELKGGKALI